MFSPSSCPGHYSRHLATMASADSCLFNLRIASQAAGYVFFLAVHLHFVTHSLAEPSMAVPGLWGTGSPPVVSLGRIDIPLGKQASPNSVKYPLEGYKVRQLPICNRIIYRISCSMGIIMLHPKGHKCSLPGDAALYDVSVPRNNRDKLRPISLPPGFLQTTPHGDALAIG